MSFCSFEIEVNLWAASILDVFNQYWKNDKYYDTADVLISVTVYLLIAFRVNWFVDEIFSYIFPNIWNDANLMLCLTNKWKVILSSFSDKAGGFNSYSIEN